DGEQREGRAGGRGGLNETAAVELRHGWLLGVWENGPGRFRVITTDRRGDVQQHPSPDAMKSAVRATGR
ncbi:MAG: hypothetical protein KDA38_17790, partial [Planctomycetales bacterium]|nr:hypothetical protein [Planctomycetales bacterium]